MRELARMKLGVDGDGAETRVPDGVEDLDELGAVLHRQADPVARRKVQAVPEPGRQRRDTLGQPGVGAIEVRPDGDRRLRAEGARRPRQEGRRVHGSPPLSPFAADAVTSCR